MEVWPLRFLRPEQRFSEVEELKQQISKDIQAAEHFFNAESSISSAT